MKTKKLIFAALILIFSTSLIIKNESIRAQPNNNVITDGSYKNDPLYKYVFSTQAIDNHSHLLFNRTEKSIHWDPNNPLGNSHYNPMVVRLRTNNPEWIEAWKALYNYKYNDMAPDHLIELLQVKKDLVKMQKDSFTFNILNKCKISAALINTENLECKNSRLIWVPYADKLIYPFNIDLSTDIDKLPENLNAYINDVIIKQLKEWKKEGAVAIKFLFAYWRSLKIEKISENQAEDIYKKAIDTKNEPDEVEYKQLQDYLVFKIASGAGQYGLVAHFHTGNGEGPYFNNANCNPILLEDLLNDSTTHQTRFVIIHGGWPFTEITAALLDKPNVYADYSAQTFVLYPHYISNSLRLWLELQPEKVLFATDAYSSGGFANGEFNTPLADCEELLWLSGNTARKALYLALKGMVKDGEISDKRAKEIAEMVLNGNAKKLYNLK